MATTVKELKATARPSSGKGAARAERRAGRVPGVIYGDNQPPVTISVEDGELRLRIQNAESAPGVKRGGTVNIVTHTIDLECSVDNIPQFIEADVGALEISHSLHLSDVKLPTGVRALSREDATLVTIVPPSGYAEEQKAAAAAAAGGPAAAAPA